MRRWLGDQLRAAANTLDPPKPIRITLAPVIVRMDSRAVADAVLAASLKPKPRHVTLFERIIGHIFGWL